MDCPRNLKHLIFHIPQALQNCMSMVECGGHFLSITCGNNYLGHGFYQFSPEFFFRTLTPANGFEIVSVLLCEAYENPPVFYSVRDPQLYGGRVELVNRRPVYILTIAKRIHANGVSQLSPQQSDYVSMWDKKVQPKAASAGSVAGTPFLLRARRSLRRRLKGFLGNERWASIESGWTRFVTALPQRHGNRI